MRFLTLILLQVGLIAPTFAQDAVQSSDGRWGIVSGAHGPRVRDARGNSNPLNIAESVRIHSLVSVRAGWVAAGARQVGDRRELYFRMLDAGGLKRLPAPGLQRSGIRHQPVILSDGEELLGVLWLEGDSEGSLSVRASLWLGITWSAPVTVAPPGPGSQVALTAAVLSDGSWLAAWTRFDGEDDEIMVSIGLDNSWTPPSPLSANAVPDILPTIAACEGGALIAWNQYDGQEYRVVTMRLAEGRWIEGQTEARGSLYPSFVLDGDRPSLLFYDVSGAWKIHEMDREGRIVRRGSARALSSDRPLILRTSSNDESDGEVKLLWPIDSREARVTWNRRP